MIKRLITAASVLALLAIPALAAGPTKTVKIGFITTLSGPAGVIGKHMKDSADLALADLGGKIGGLPAEIIYGDDQQKPEIGLQIAHEMMERDKVNFVAGIIWSNVLLAVLHPVTATHTILVGTNAGAHPVAGKECSPYFFSTSWQNDETPEALGKYMTEKHITDVYAMAPNYAAGRDMITGFKRYFKGKIVGEVYTKLGQSDYQAEISQIRAAHPKAVFVFYPGGMGIQFVKQYAEAGLRGEIPLYSVFTSDATTLPAQRDTALGNYEAGSWSPDVDVPASKAFVAAFEKKYGYLPSYYGEQSYDAIMLINSAVKAVKGNLDDKEGLIAAMDKADFTWTRPYFRYNTNHIPIENFYLFRIAKNAEGQYYRKVEATIFTHHKDAYYHECSMK